jgi:ribonuclease III
MDHLSRLEQALGHRFASHELLNRALTHPSIIGTGAVTAAQAYERLEFLGDRVLGLIVAELLLRRFPNETEGDIAKRHAMLVRRQTLADVARNIDLGSMIRAVPGEGASDAGMVENKSILADACEAVIAALYRDGGLEAASKFIAAHWEPLIETASAPPQDAKTQLQEWAQKRALPLPQYRVVERTGPDHQPRFVIEVALKDHEPARAEGGSKQRAEQAAAQALLDRIVTGEGR